MKEVYLDIAPLPPFPNHGEWPLIHYLGAAPESRIEAVWFEKIFAENGWGDAWRNGVFSYHHFHSTAHEVLGCYAGSAVVQFGGPKGPHVEFGAGDAVVVPAGVGHCLMSADNRFQVVGAYPEGTYPDLMRGEPEKYESALKRSLSVPLPPRDPIFGLEGPLGRNWNNRP
jgi:uncharacterized protein YjlB